MYHCHRWRWNSIDNYRNNRIYMLLLLVRSPGQKGSTWCSCCTFTMRDFVKRGYMLGVRLRVAKRWHLFGCEHVSYCFLTLKQKCCYLVNLKVIETVESLTVVKKEWQPCQSHWFSNIWLYKVMYLLRSQMIDHRLPISLCSSLPAQEYSTARSAATGTRSTPAGTPRGTSSTRTSRANWRPAAVASLPAARAAGTGRPWRRCSTSPPREGVQGVLRAARPGHRSVPPPCLPWSWALRAPARRAPLLLLLSRRLLRGLRLPSLR